MTAPQLHWRGKSLAVKAYLRAIAATGKPIILGPWRSELGFEVLYWLPFLTWALKYAGIEKERCIALSRGGMGAMYPATGYTDLYTVRSVDELRIENQVEYQTRKKLKQDRVQAWDRAVCAEAAARFGINSYHVLHPSWMYWLFNDFWEEKATVRLVVDHSRFEPLPVPNLPPGLELPKDFIAVRFYERATFPLNGAVKAMATDVTRKLAQHHPVVLLNQGLFADDHTDLPITGENICSLQGAIKPEENFILQAAILARCEAFVGTYGGVAQWALRYKKPTLSFYTTFHGTLHAHRNFSHMLAAHLETPFECSDMRMGRIWTEATGGQLLETVAA